LRPEVHLRYAIVAMVMLVGSWQIISYSIHLPFYELIEVIGG
jgi:hypothetical protein